jgi:hypothetical protein
MDMKQWSVGVIAMLVLAAVVLTGITVTDEYGYQLRKQTTGSEDGITPLVDTSVRVGSVGEYPYLQDLTDCVNATDGQSIPTSYYEVTEGNEDGGFIVLQSAGQDINNSAINCSGVVYLADTDAQGAADNFSAGLAIFGTFAVVVALSIVGKSIIGMWRKE